MRPWTRAILRIPITLLFAGLFVVALVRLAPGYGVDERELDPGFGAEGVRAMRRERPSALALARDHASRALRGDWGTSEIFGAPVADLLSDRWPITLASVAAGLAMAWALALAWAALALLYRPFDWTGSLASFALLSFPSGALAVFLFLAGAPVSVGIGVAVFPQIYRYVRQLAFDALSQPCVFAAAARGAGRLALVCRHARALIAPQLLALLGASAATALGASIPMEAISGAPGLGQLAWRAALGRDLPLLLPLVLLMTLAVQAAALASDLLRRDAMAVDS